MARRVIWYLARSPARPLLSELPADLEPLPVPPHGLPTLGDDESAALVLGLAGGDSAAAAEAAA